MTQTILSLIVAIIGFALEMFKEAAKRNSANTKWQATQSEIYDMQITVMSAQIDKIKEEVNQTTNMNQNPLPKW
jgi:peptidoglycan hydrolase CwlO-like protein